MSSTWRAGGPDTEIRFAIGQCTLGAILVAATPKGICAITLGDEPEALLHGLQARFHKAELIGGVTELLQRILGKNPGTTVVTIDEVDLDNWGIGGLPVTEFRAAQAAKAPPQ